MAAGNQALKGTWALLVKAPIAKSPKKIKLLLLSNSPHKLSVKRLSESPIIKALRIRPSPKRLVKTVKRLALKDLPLL